MIIGIECPLCNEMVYVPQCIVKSPLASDVGVWPALYAFMVLHQSEKHKDALLVDRLMVWEALDAWKLENEPQFK
jgi:hypothetical protein